jgi:hypothetical protein
MTLYAIMGVQLFGRMEYHCVLPGTDPNNVTIAGIGQIVSKIVLIILIFFLIPSFY